MAFEDNKRRNINLMAKPSALRILALVVAGGASLGGGYWLRQSSDSAAPIDWNSSVAHETLVASAGGIQDLPESDYYRRVVDILDRNYVDEHMDEQKMAIGAIRGMITSLADPLASYMTKEQFAVFLKNQSGEFEGIGVELKLNWNDEKLAKYKKDEQVDSSDLVPDLIVTAIAPGSPAEKAGIKIGDRVESVDGRWVLSARRIEQFRTNLAKIRESKLTSEEMNTRIRAQFDGFKEGMSPVKAKDLVTMGTSGKVILSWQRDKEVLKAEIARQNTTWPSVIKTDGGVQFRFFTGAEKDFEQLLSTNEPLIIDLRNSTQGNFDTLLKIVEKLAPAKRYGYFVHDDGKVQSSLESKATAKPWPALTFIVDTSTRGAAEILATAFGVDKSATKIQGGKMAGELSLIRTTLLPDKSGFAMPIGKFATQLESKDLNKPKKMAMSNSAEVQG